MTPMTLFDHFDPDDANEAVVTGIGQIGDRSFVAAVFDFGVQGGSMGVEAGSRLQAAMRRALELRLPFVAVTSTGGARLQEGMAALAQMPGTVAASIELGAAGVPRISVLSNPTTGGVYASFASLADFIIAEAGATIGFAGPRVVETATGEPLPPGSHTAEAAFRAGLVDAVVPSEQIKPTLALLLELLAP